jgi:hypothetical protein
MQGTSPKIPEKTGKPEQPEQPTQKSEENLKPASAFVEHMRKKMASRSAP